MAGNAEADPKLLQRLGQLLHEAEVYTRKILRQRHLLGLLDAEARAFLAAGLEGLALDTFEEQ
eukprot:5995319-Pyramimonas_sp.AAC.1